MYKRKDINVVIPAAGRGSRVTHLFDGPKPLLPVNDKPLIHHVIESLNFDANYTFIFQKQHEISWKICDVVRKVLPDANFVLIDGVTEGAACTALKAAQYIDNDKQLLISDCDQAFGWQAADFFPTMEKCKADGGLVTFYSQSPNKSYCDIDMLGRVIRVAEKEVISEYANTGTYYFARGNDFIRAADKMIAENKRVNNEFYIAPCYNELIAEGAKVEIYNISDHYPLGTQMEIEDFFKVKLSD